MRKTSVVALGVLLSATVAACGGQMPTQTTQGANDASAMPADGNLVDQSAALDTSMNSAVTAVPGEAATTAAVAPLASPTPAPTPGATKVAATPPPGFAQCAVCHSTKPGVRGMGPSLAGVYGTKAAAVRGYTFSPAMQKSQLTWDAATLDHFLKSPRQVVPGTKMIFAGISDDTKRAAVVAYLKAIQ